MIVCNPNHCEIKTHNNNNNNNNKDENIPGCSMMTHLLMTLTTNQIKF